MGDKIAGLFLWIVAILDFGIAVAYFYDRRWPLGIAYMAFSISQAAVGPGYKEGKTALSLSMSPYLNPTLSFKLGDQVRTRKNSGLNSWQNVVFTIIDVKEISSKLTFYIVEASEPIDGSFKWDIGTGELFESV